MSDEAEQFNVRRQGLCWGLDRPDIPLHTNGNEPALRDPVKKRQISNGTRSDLGRRCRDTLMSLKQGCRKLGISFWHYLTDQLSRTHAIPPLPDLIRQGAAIPQGVPWLIEKLCRPFPKSRRCALIVFIEAGVLLATGAEKDP